MPTAAAASIIISKIQTKKLTKLGGMAVTGAMLVPMQSSASSSSSYSSDASKPAKPMRMMTLFLSMSGDLTYFTNPAIFIVRKDIAKATGAKIDSILVKLYAGSIILRVTLPASAGGALISDIQSKKVTSLAGRKVESVSFQDPYLADVDKNWVAAQKLAVSLGVDSKVLMQDASKKAMLSGFCKAKKSVKSASASSASSSAAPRTACSLNEIKAWARANGGDMPGALGQFARALAGAGLHKIVASFEAAAGKRHKTSHPTLTPSLIPTKSPTLTPTIHPSNHPTHNPSPSPTEVPTMVPTLHPTHSLQPTSGPTGKQPSGAPSPTPTTKTHAPTNNLDAKAERLAKNHHNYLGFKYE